MTHTRHRRRAYSRLFDSLGDMTKMISAADAPWSFRRWLADILLKETPQKPSKQILPLKHVRLQQLSDAGINVPYFHYWLRGELIVPELEAFRKEFGSISLRNVTEEKECDQTPKLPVEYEKTDPAFIIDYCSRHNKLYHTLVNQAYPLCDSKIAGNIILLDDEKYIVSYFEGYGTPRDVDNKPSSELKVYLRQFSSRAPAWAPSVFDDLIARLQTVHLSFSPIIPKTFEFSIYPYPVGTLQRPEVFWEWRSGSAQDLYTIITRILERADSHEMIFSLSGIPASELKGRSHSL